MVKTLHLKNLPSGERRVIHLRLYLNKYNLDGALAPSAPGDLQRSVSPLPRMNQPPCLIPHYAAVTRSRLQLLHHPHKGPQLITSTALLINIQEVGEGRGGW